MQTSYFEHVFVQLPLTLAFFFSFKRVLNLFHKIVLRKNAITIIFTSSYKIRKISAFSIKHLPKTNSLTINCCSS